MPGYVYILASRRNGTLYIGVTSDLFLRVRTHREGGVSCFTKQYGIKTLVYYKYFDQITDAIHREKQMKEWKRAWKIDLIERDNPQWLDLFDRIGPQ